MLSIGIVGLPNVGKSTLFNALTKSKQADAQNYPFCTIEPNTGIVEVPDKRLNKLSEVSQSQKTVPTTIEFVDIAGLVKGASEGEGLGNKFLSHIREVDAIAHVVRSFDSGDVTHVHNRVDPKDDADVINLELIMADWQTVSKRLEVVKAKAKGVKAKEFSLELAFLERLDSHLQSGKPARSIERSEEERVLMRDLHLISNKPVMYVVNTSDGDKNQLKIEENVPHVYVSARLEAELAELSDDEAQEYMNHLGISESGLDQMIKKGYELLNLVTFFTSGEKESRAWTCNRGSKAPEAASKIHTDFEKGFIKAEVALYEDFVSQKGWNGVKEEGKMSLVGKEYEVRDGDVVYFHVSA